MFLLTGCVPSAITPKQSIDSTLIVTDDWVSLMNNYSDVKFKIQALTINNKWLIRKIFSLSCNALYYNDYRQIVTNYSSNVTRLSDKSCPIYTSTVYNLENDSKADLFESNLYESPSFVKKIKACFSTRYIPKITVVHVTKEYNLKCDFFKLDIIFKA